MDDTYTRAIAQKCNINTSDQAVVQAETFITDIEFVDNNQGNFSKHALGNVTHAELPPRNITYDISIENELVSPILCPDFHAGYNSNYISSLCSLDKDVPIGYLSTSGIIHRTQRSGHEYYDDAKVKKFAACFKHINSFQIPAQKVNVTDAFEDLTFLYRRAPTETMPRFDIVIPSKYLHLQGLCRDVANWKWLAFFIDLVNNEGQARRECYAKYEIYFQCLYVCMLFNHADAVTRTPRTRNNTIHIGDFSRQRTSSRVLTFTYTAQRYEYCSKFIQILVNLLAEANVINMNYIAMTNSEMILQQAYHGDEAALTQMYERIDQHTLAHLEDMTLRDLKQHHYNNTRFYAIVCASNDFDVGRRNMYETKLTQYDERLNKRIGSMS